MADVAQARYASGRSSQQDVLKPVLELSKLHADVLMYQEQADISSARLNALLNRDPETPVGPLAEPREATLVPGVGALQQMATAHQPELQRARVEIERAEAELAVAKRDRAPDFTVQGGYLLLPNQTDALLARVGVTWPNAPWSRGKIDAHVAEQTSAVAAAVARERAMENSLRLAVQEAYVHATTAQARAALLRTTILPQSQQLIALSRIAYQTDRVDFQALIDNERTQLDSQLDYVRAVSDFEQAIADLERTVGTDLPAGTTATVVSQAGN
jgi:outer membrane protein TolC